MIRCEGTVEHRRLKILAVGASPRTRAVLDVNAELVRLQVAIRASSCGRSVEVVPRIHLQPDDLRRALREEEPDVVHFIGHGTRSGELIFEDAQRSEVVVPGHALAELLGKFRSRVRLVVFNACHSDRLAAAAVEHIDFAVGMDEGIRDDAAIVFAVGLYEGLASGDRVREAFEFGKNAVALNNLPGERVPQLRVRAGLDEGAAGPLVVRDRPGGEGTIGQAAEKESERERERERERRKRPWALVAAGLGALAIMAGFAWKWRHWGAGEGPRAEASNVEASFPSTLPARIADQTATIPSGAIDGGARTVAPEPPATTPSRTGHRFADGVPSASSAPSAPAAHAISGTATCVSQSCTLSLGGLQLENPRARVCLHAPASAEDLAGRTPTCRVTAQSSLGANCPRSDAVATVALKPPITWSLCD